MKALIFIAILVLTAGLAYYFFFSDDSKKKQILNLSTLSAADKEALTKALASMTSAEISDTYTYLKTLALGDVTDAALLSRINVISSKYNLFT